MYLNSFTDFLYSKNPKQTFLGSEQYEPVPSINLRKKLIPSYSKIPNQQQDPKKSSFVILLLFMNYCVRFFFCNKFFKMLCFICDFFFYDLVKFLLKHINR